MRMILLIATGGTIASRPTAAGGLAPAITSQELLSCVPELAEFCRIDTIQLYNLDSTNMGPEQWQGIAAAVQENYDRYDGFVITHGTDTMGYTAAALSYMIQKSPKPVVLTGSLSQLSRDDAKARLVALDGFRLAIQKAVMPFELPGGKENVRVVIPGRVLNEMSKVLGDTDEYCTLVFDQSRMTASFGTTTLSTVLLTGEYIDYRKILPASFRTTALADRVGVQNAIDRASLMAREGKNNLIRMSFSGDTLTISSNAELGDVLEELETELTGDPIEIAFNAKYITDVIRNITDEKLCMRFNSNVSPCVIAPQEGEDYLYLILPVRVFT